MESLRETGSKRGGNVPHAVDSFIGRTELLARAQERLSTSRLVTLFGVGGGGKTRLAFEIAAQAEQSGEFADGVWIADLTPAKDADMLLQTVLSAVDAPDQSTRQLRKTLLEHLQDKHMLLVLDNCEHLMPAPSKLAVSLLEAAPQLRILATSRAPLGVRGEAVEPVEPMAVPPLNAAMPAAPYEEYESVQLFWSFIHNIVPRWSITEANWPDVVQLLRWVDGIPLAIELAAKRLRSMSLKTLVDRMGDMYKVLNKNGEAPMHHETLDAVFDLNLKLCSDAEKLLWARVSTFAGHFTLAAAEEVCADDKLPRDQIADALDGLVKYSVVATTEERERYRLLTPVRQFGAKLCAEHGEQEMLRQKHRDYYLNIVAEAAATWYAPQEFEVLDELADDLDNFRAVMADYVVAPDPGQTGMQMSVNLGRTRLYFKLGEMREAVSWLSRTREATPAPDPQLGLSAQSLDLFIDLCIGADEDVVRPRLRQLAADAEGLGPVPAVRFATGVGMLWLDEDLAGGVPLLEEAYEMFRAAGPDTHGDAAMAMLIQAVGQALMADLDEAAAAAARLAAETQRAGAPWMIRWAQWCEAIVEMRFRDPALAVKRLEDLLRERTDVDDNWLTMWLVEVLAWAAATAGAAGRAAVVLGVSSELHDRTGVRVEKLAPFARHRCEAEKSARRMLGERAFQKAFSYGAAFATEKAVASGVRGRVLAAARHRALEDSAAPLDADDSPWDLLTAQQQKVARLVGQGKTNDEIAGSLFISVRTVDAHLRNIRESLRISDRVVLATWALEHDPMLRA